MATNEILAFDATDTNTLTQAEYSADAQRTGGMVAGIARSKLFNKSLKQSSIIAAGVAQFMADHQAVNVTDSLTPAQISTYLADAVTDTITDVGNFARLNLAQLFTAAQRGEEEALPATTGTVTLNLDTSNNYGGTLTGNITLANPTNIVKGQAGIIRIINDSTPRTISYGSYFKGAAGTLPALTASAGAEDLLAYYVLSSTSIWVGIVGDVK